MDRGFNIPLVGRQNTMGRGFKIPWIRGHNTVDRSFNIAWVDPPTRGVLTLPTDGIFNPLPMVFSTTYPWYFDPPTHGILTPLPMVFRIPSFGKNEGIQFTMMGFKILVGVFKYQLQYNSLLAQPTPNIGSKATNKQKMDQTHTQTTIIHKQTKNLFHNITNVIIICIQYTPIILIIDVIICIYMYFVLI
jgi:hypothetical protein